VYNTWIELDRYPKGDAASKIKRIKKKE